MDNEAASSPVDDPAEAAFRLGCQAVQAWEWDRAQELFEEAVRTAGPPMLWRVTEAWLDRGQTSAWMRRAVVAESEPGGITIDPTALEITGGNDSDVQVQNWEIAVESDDPERAVVALTAAEPRLMCVFEDGRELSPEDAEELMDEAMPPYNPNYAAVDATVPRIWMDCKGGLYPHMARTMLRIVADELRKAGIRQTRLFSRSQRQESEERAGPPTPAPPSPTQ
ncbi:hypothetical protein [Kitasatospora sp. NPDC057223]|uniref:hypothetical protein n=1 Tax=Kitasatospora sp. NPDC057223 TaxID=3346055 RepID=UPI003633BED4